MSTGEINYDDLMHKDTTTAYYKFGFVLLVLLTITMTIFVVNLLIGNNHIYFLSYSDLFDDIII